MSGFYIKFKFYNQIIDKLKFVIGRFQKACIKYGVPEIDLFQAVDLIERKNIAQVTNTIFAIGRTVRIINLLK